MKIKSYSVTPDPISGICKQPSLWGYSADKNAIVPIIYFQKPKWMDDQSFREVVTYIKLELPMDFEIKYREKK